MSKMAVGDALVLIPFSRLLLKNLSQRVKYLSKYWFYCSRGHCSILFVQVTNLIWPSDLRFRAHTRVSTYGRWRGFLSKIGVFSSVGKGGKAGKFWCVLFLIRFVPFMWLKLLWDFRGVRILSAGSDQSAAAVGVFTAIFCHFSTQNRSHKGIMVNYAVCYDHSSILSHLEQPGAVLSPPE